MNRTLFRNTAILFFIIGILDLIANKLYLYWTVWWFDMILHFLSGGVVAMTAILLLQSFFNFRQLSRKNIVWVSLFFVFLIGVSWEIFEWYFNITFLSDGIVYWKDTLSDMCLDLIGGYLGLLYSFSLINKNE